MPQPRSDQHHGRITVRETADDSCPAANLFHDPLQAVIGPQPGPVFIREIHVGQRFFHAFLHELRHLVQLQRAEFFATRSAFSRAASLSSCAWIAFSMAATSRTCFHGHMAKALRYQWTTQRCHFASGKKSPRISYSPRHLSEMISLTPGSPRSFKYRRKLLHDSLSSRLPSATPRISR